MNKLIQYSKEWASENTASNLQKLTNYLNQSTAHSLNLQDRIINMDKSMTWDLEELYVSDSFNIKLLMIPKGNKMPLHNHPGMTVLLKPLWGHFLISNYDWCEEFPFSGIAKQKSNTVVNGSTLCATVSPDQNNIHQMIALEDCAFIDVMSPPYNEEREISYLNITKEFTHNGEDLVHFEIKN
ncbi:MAG: hypothetical protein COB02_03100 [Candidatus Cloacimonadota bacterium]|nr:MAG: hypothetical protein COB02_03100 [Candidatus Cloacimonadota bacterium]